VANLRSLRKFAGWQGKAYIQSGSLPQRSEEVGFLQKKAFIQSCGLPQSFEEAGFLPEKSLYPILWFT